MTIQKYVVPSRSALLLLVVALFGVGLGQGATAQAAPSAATVTIELWAKTGTLALPGGGTVPIWGYALNAGDPAQVPGPAIIANAGDTVQVTLHNTLGEATALFFGGQALPPDLTGAAAGSGTATYTFVATNPGTYLYEAGPLPNAQHQSAMGLFGALIVRPLTAGQAYNSAATTYDDEAVVVLSEIDPVLNNLANPANFDMRAFSPRYWLINGKAHPDTPAIASAAGRRVLLRYVNAGLQYHSMTVLGLNQTVVAKDGSLLPYPNNLAADTIAPGQTVDTITTIPATAAPASRFALYDGNFLNLRNTNAAGFGGMVTFITTATGGPSPDTAGPTTSGVAVSTNVLSASVSDVATGGSNVTAAEYYVDNTAGAPTAMSGTFGAPTVAVNATLAPALLTSSHIFYVRGQDAVGNWGAFSSVTYTAPDTTGPATSGLLLTPNPTDGSVDVQLSGTGNDSAAGNSNVAAAEYFIDTPGVNGAGIPMIVAAPAVIAALDVTIPAATVFALSEGAHVIHLHSQDAIGNWGPFAQINLLVDRTGPTTSNVTAAPNPNNGLQGISPSQAAVRVDAVVNESNVFAAAAPPAESFTAQLFIPLVMAAQADPAAAANAAAIQPGVPYVQRVEGFIDTVGANGTGFPFTPSDGFYDSATEGAYVFIPLSTIAALSTGGHTIYVHAQDGAGNWGAYASTILMIDKGVPSVSGVTVTPNPTDQATIVTLTANGSDANTPLLAAEWFVGSDPGAGNGTAMAAADGAFDSTSEGLTATINVASFTPGNYPLSVRVKDSAGNWSAAGSVTLTVSGSSFYFSTTGNNNPPGVGGTADDADIYRWDGVAFSRMWDASTSGIPGAANVDGLVWVDASHFYLSFVANLNLPGVGAVQDEDIVFYNNGIWSLYFDGTPLGLTNDNHDIDAFDIVDGMLYFSTLGNTNPPGVGGAADDADIYSWNGSAFNRVFDASANGLPGNADVDGLSVIDVNNFYLSFNAANTTVPGIGAVQDEDVVRYTAGVWSMHFDGTARGLTNNNHDLDAIDIP